MPLRILRPPLKRLGAGLGGALILGGCGLPGGPAAPELAGKYTTWSMYEGDPGALHYSALSQIDRSNVRQLQVAWSYPIGDGSGAAMSP